MSVNSSPPFRKKGFAAAHADFFDGFQAIRNEGGTNDGESFDA